MELERPTLVVSMDDLPFFQFLLDGSVYAVIASAREVFGLVTAGIAWTVTLE